jgi:hypothetical protein
MRYVLITGLLTVVYVALVILTTQMLHFSRPDIIAAETVVAVLLFNLPRRRLQRAVRRRYHRPA